jgi:sulfofructose kinase
MQVDVLCVGIAAYDLIFSVSHHPQPDEKTKAEHLLTCGGGPAANAAVAVNRLGLQAAFCGYIGNDFYGQQILSEFNSEGVNTKWIKRGEAATSLSMILVKPNGDRTVILHRANKKYLQPYQFDLNEIKPSVILFDGHEPHISLSLIKKAKEKKIKTILDAGSLHRGTKELIHDVDYLICSEKFAQEYTGLDQELGSLKILAMHCPKVIITLGDRGIIWKFGAKTGTHPAFPIKAIDTTGAGDAFHGAFAAGLTQNSSWEYLLRFASAVAALTCTRIGARIGLPRKDEVDQFLATHKL